MNIKIRVWGHVIGEDYRIHENCSFDCAMIPREYGTGDIICDHKNLLFTGLLDKQGKEYYEGDIYKNPECIGLLKVVFHKGCFYGEQIVHVEGLSGEDNFGSISSISPNERYEIIGNIYENQELI
jgi:hypothetical protein